MNLPEVFFEIFFPTRASYFKLAQIPQAPSINNIKNAYCFFDYHSPKGKELIYYIKKYKDHLLSKKIALYIYRNLLEEMSEFYQFNEFLDPVIIPIPISKQAKRKRGFNQVAKLSKEISRLFNGTYFENILLKNKETQKQALIQQRHKRHINVSNCFSVSLNKRHLIEGKDIILIDDLYTTGATTKEASRILLKNKVRNIIIITLAH